MVWTGTVHNGEGDRAMAREKVAQPKSQGPVWEWFMGDPTTVEGAEIARDYYLDLASQQYFAAEALWNRAAQLKNAHKYGEGDDLSTRAQEIHEQGQQAEHVDAERMIALVQALKGR